MNTSLNALLIKAEEQLNNNDFQAAYNIYYELVKEHKNSPEIYNNLAIAAYQLQKYQESIDYIAQALKLEPNNPIYIAQYAQFLFTTDFNLADRLFNTAIKLAATAEIKTQIEDNYSALLYNQACLIAKDLNTIQQHQAIELFNKSLKFRDNNYKAYFNIACCYANLNNLPVALDYLNKTIACKSDHADAHFALSQFYQQNNNISQAEFHLQQALAAKSSQQAMAEFNYGVLEYKKNNYPQAILHYKNSLKINPHLFAACYNLGSLYQKLKNHEDAIFYYKKALEINPQDPTCRYLIASLNNHSNNKAITKAPALYIEQLFDNYAPDFDYDLVTNLNYKTHILLRDLFLEHVTDTTQLNILDLGCGTGLAGELFKSNSKIVTGVDLSQKMLDVASEKKIYDHLIKAEINEYLNGLNKNDNLISHSDLILLSDVLVYYGQLDELFNNIKQHLMSKCGYLLFSVELLKSDNNDNLIDYQLTINGRYSHSIDYINRLTMKKFTTIASKEVILRTQEGHDVHGLICLVQALAVS